MTAMTSSIPPRPTAPTNRCDAARRREGVLCPHQLGGAPEIPEDAGDFRLLSPRAAAALRQLPERNRFFKGLASWIGFRQLRIDYEPAPRADGRTSWNIGSLMGLSVEGLTSFSVAPLRSPPCSASCSRRSRSCYSVWILSRQWSMSDSVPGYPSLFVGIMVLGGVQLIMIGVVGEYIGKMLSETQSAGRSISSPSRASSGRRRRDSSLPRAEAARNAAE